MTNLNGLVVGIALGVLGSTAAACDGLTVTDAWVREPPPGAGAVAVYMRLANAGESALAVDSVSSPAFAHGMLHETYVDGDRARMRHVDALRLAPGEQRELAPGGLHVMLVKPVAALPTVGDDVALVLGCGDARLELQVPVRRE
jgi:hypothetical protein